MSAREASDLGSILGRIKPKAVKIGIPQLDVQHEKGAVIDRKVVGSLNRKLFFAFFAFFRKL